MKKASLLCSAVLILCLVATACSSQGSSPGGNNSNGSAVTESVDQGTTPNKTEADSAVTADTAEESASEDSASQAGSSEGSFRTLSRGFYENSRGWTVRFEPSLFKVEENGDDVKFIYTGEAVGENLVEIRYVPGGNPQEVLEEELKKLEEMVAGSDGEDDEDEGGENAASGDTSEEIAAEGLTAAAETAAENPTAAAETAAENLTAAAETAAEDLTAAAETAAEDPTAAAAAEEPEEEEEEEGDISIVRDEGYFIDDTWCFTATVDYSDDERDVTEVFQSAEYNDGVLLTKLKQGVTDENILEGFMGDALWDLVETLSAYRYEPQTQFADVPGTYTRERGSENAVDTIILRPDHLGSLIFQDRIPVYWGSTALTEKNAERSYEYTLDGDTLVLHYDGEDLTFKKSEDQTAEENPYTDPDYVAELNKTINSSDYSADTKGDYIGSLSTRLKSLTNGINGKIFTAQEMDLDILFNQNAIVDTSRVGSMETKALIMGLLILKLQEFRYSNAMGTDLPLKHITVLEEAHNILKKTSTEQSTETANLQGKSVEMLANTIAEIRTYGEGFIIVDQAPNLLDTASIRNTNTKIVFRLPEGNDRKITGTSMALTDIQIDELSKLPTGVACIYQNDWHEAVLCKLPKFTSSEKLDVQKISKSESQKEKNDWILHQLLKKEYSEEELAILKDSLIKSNISSKIKLELILNIEKKNLEFEYAVASFINKNYKYTDVFRKVVEESSSWNNVDELLNMLTKEISKVFTSFDEKERNQILLYICKMKNENIFDSQIIEALKDEVRDDLAIRIVKVISSKILAPKEEKRELFT